MPTFDIWKTTESHMLVKADNLLEAIRKAKKMSASSWDEYENEYDGEEIADEE